MEIQKKLSENAMQWLMDKSSLTKRLKKATQNKIHFCLIQDWQLENSKYNRMIEWQLEGIRWIQAKSFIPENSINEHTKALFEVNTRPIGEILFDDPNLKRTDFLLCEESDLTWTRRSIFDFKGQPLILIETFYPAFFAGIALC